MSTDRQILHDDDVELVPFEEAYLKHSEHMLDLWPIIRMTSAEAALHNIDNLFTFVDQCIYFAIVKTRRLPTSPIIDAAQPTNTHKGSENDPLISEDKFLNPEIPSVLDDYRRFTLNNGHQPILAGPPSIMERLGIPESHFPIDDRRNVGGLPSFSDHTCGLPGSQDVPLNVGAQQKIVGIVYLTASQIGEVSLGVVTDPAHRGCGYAKHAVSIMAAYCFDELRFHRISAVIMHTSQPGVEKNSALSLFTKLGFAHEGTRRRSICVPSTGEWTDVTSMGLLDTDWVMRDYTSARALAATHWDALFARHQREREELLRWESRILRRRDSTETIRNLNDAAPLAPSFSSSSLSSAASPSSRLSLSLQSKGKATMKHKKSHKSKKVVFTDNNSKPGSSSSGLNIDGFGVRAQSPDSSPYSSDYAESISSSLAYVTPPPQSPTPTSDMDDWDFLSQGSSHSATPSLDDYISSDSDPFADRAEE
ncbi:hypothetical protein SISSUDRAFT_1039854 [Sistotremastrum suecicum HHB10207 ss-3]|uniref:N-acetyltransferase domain-containing protein n=1 Tax=Sistotremastrum suecicum HHB10207 ss-3 TaxID=1314776 RepID=A0A166IP62_9AGAM|nr:hypothetical protein SISSUDRAFT_1039854 [Sistotremastrum suecicum HHB10207 ss-3]